MVSGWVLLLLLHWLLVLLWLRLLWLLLCLRLVPLAGVVAATAGGCACCCNNYCFWRLAAAVGYWRWPAAAGCGSCWLVLWLLLLDTVAAASCSSSLG